MAGWLRRNAWGLLLLVPAMGAVTAAPYLQTFDSFLRGQEREAVTPGAEHWVTYAGTRMRLVEMSQERTLPTYNGKTVPAPPGLRIMKAVLEFDGVPDDQSMWACRLFLESTDGERFGEKPTELTSVDTVSLPDGGCVPENNPVPAPSGSPAPSPLPSGVRAQWRTVCYFAMPLTAYPIGVRVSIVSELPRYALLE